MISTEVYRAVAKFNMIEAKLVNTSLVVHLLLSVTHCPTDVIKKDFTSYISYESAVDSLMYLMICRRPDIAFFVVKVSMYMSNPCKMHWEVGKWILR